MILSYNDLLYYLSEDKKSLGINRRFPYIWGDEIWKLQIRLRITEYIHNIRGNNILLKILSKWLRYRFKQICARRCCEIPINCIGPGLCIWHGFNIIINPSAKIGRNFGISANCNVGHAHNNVPIIGDNVTMSLGSQVLGGIHICNNVTIGAKALVLTDIDTEYCTVGGVPAKILTIHTPSNFVRG